ncbi:MAG: Nif3-like dinuclear metal center hexameric protein, partial [Flavobacteriales bacterium]|nr:Nif3-like dinuclear metal center hexameric protein [Flavobacteriales bacterium]
MARSGTARAAVGALRRRGAFLIRHALAAGADAFITADLKYHDCFQADGRMLLADVGHYGSEQFTMRL